MITLHNVQNVIQTEASKMQPVNIKQIKLNIYFHQCLISPEHSAKQNYVVLTQTRQYNIYKMFVSGSSHLLLIVYRYNDALQRFVSSSDSVLL